MTAKVTFIDASNYLRRAYEKATVDSGMRTSVRDLRTLISGSYNPIMVFDGWKANAFRRSIYAPYKDNRLSAPDNFYEQVSAFQEIAKHLNMISIRVPEYEADDVIAELAKGFVTAGKAVHIKSTDRDFQQLHGVTYEGKVLDVPPEQVVLYKVLVGDKSDNIKGVPGFGEKKWEALDKSATLLWMEADFDPALQPVLPNALAEWCRANTDTLRAMRDVCKFRPVSDELIDQNAIFGRDNPDKVEEILKEHLA